MGPNNGNASWQGGSGERGAVCILIVRPAYPGPLVTTDNQYVNSFYRAAGPCKEVLRFPRIDENS